MRKKIRREGDFVWACINNAIDRACLTKNYVETIKLLAGVFCRYPDAIEAAAEITGQNTKWQRAVIDEIQEVWEPKLMSALKTLPKLSEDSLTYAHQILAQEYDKEKKRYVPRYMAGCGLRMP